jgi:hypothetical protein
MFKSYAYVLLAGVIGDAFTQGVTSGRLVQHRRQLPTEPTTIPPPSYNISMPLDHFNKSETRTFNNRFFVNDTYYKAGGPVIYYDQGEMGYTNGSAAMFLGGWNGYIGAALEVAKALSGVIVALEHRYYGESHPFPLDIPAPYQGGLPIGGTADYEWLTLEQALEDVVYLANAFNKTQLGVGNVVLSGENATAHLGPHSTPWIWVGGSYPGIRGALSRLRTPDVWYATWAAGSPVQPVQTAWAYYNTPWRALPQNCTKDWHTAIKLTDEILLGDDEAAKMDLKRRVRIATMEAQSPGTAAAFQNLSDLDAHVFPYSDTNVASDLTPVLLEIAQNAGYHDNLQVFCDFMERFDVDAYAKNMSQYSNDSLAYYTAYLYAPDYNTAPNLGRRSGASCRNVSASVTLAAYIRSLYESDRYFFDVVEPYQLSRFVASDSGEVANEDLFTWSWQQLTELGVMPVSNATSPYQMTSALMNLSQYYYRDEAWFGGPLPKLNLSFLESFGGWNMQPSNVMFTTGEFDPWRAYGVFSLEQEALGAPKRLVTQEIPKCGTAPPGTDVFGIIYGGAVHVEDMGYSQGDLRGSEGEYPVYIGSKLFIQALREWLPCFQGLSVV